MGSELLQGSEWNAKTLEGVVIVGVVVVVVVVV